MDIEYCTLQSAVGNLKFKNIFYKLPFVIDNFRMLINIHNKLKQTEKQQLIRMY